MRLRSPAAAAACVLGALAAGCGGEAWQAEVFPATGRLTINGEAASGALVQLIPAPESKVDERASRPWGVVGPDGSFALSTYEGRPGAPAGDYRMTITWPPDASKPSTADRLGGRFARPAEGSPRVSIKAGENALAPVALTGVAVDGAAGAPAAPNRRAQGPPGQGPPPMRPIAGGR